MDNGFWLFGRWIFVCGGCILVVWTLDFCLVDVIFLLFRWLILVVWTCEFGCFDI